MIALLMVLSGMLVGWSGHKASLRIQAWGLRMNEQDNIFRQAEDPEHNHPLRTSSGQSAATLGGHFPFGTAGLK